MNFGQFLPGSLMVPVDYAEGIQVIAEDEQSIEFELRMGKDFYLMQSISEAEQDLGKSYD